MPTRRPSPRPSHPFVQACYILENKLSGIFETFTPAEYAAGAADDYQVIDVLPQASIPGAKWVNLSTVTGPIEGLDKDAKLLLVCARGKRGYFLQKPPQGLRLHQHPGAGGRHDLQPGEGEVQGHHPAGGDQAGQGPGLPAGQALSRPFNIRVITRNGKITAEEQRVIAEAAERYGSGEVTMTTRLTLEIQCVP